MQKLFWSVLKLSPTLLSAIFLLLERTQASEVPVRALVSNSSTIVTTQDSTSLKQNSINPQVFVASTTSSIKSVSEDILSSSRPQPPDVKLANTYQTIENPSALDALAQVTSVSQLSDVQPTDWAFQALQSLVERYGCIAGYPDSTYRGNRALTRYEFAAGLNACLDRVNELIATATADAVNREDLATLQRLQEEFSAELATLRGRVDALEAQTAELEANQFSTTTKLGGEVVFGLADVFGDSAVGGSDLEYNTIAAVRARLNFDTSFTGRDLLRTRLQARNIDNNTGETGTSMTRLGFDGDEGNDVIIDDFFYRFPLNNQFRVFLALNSFEPRDFIDVVSPFYSSGDGAVSRFGRLNPVLRIPDDSSGLAFDFKLNDTFTLAAGYLVPTDFASNPSQKAGLSDGAYAAFTNVVFNATNNFKLGLSYVRSYAPGGEVNLTGSTGSGIAQDPLGVATSADSVGAQAQLGVGEGLILSGWAGYTWAKAQASGLGVIEGNEARIFNWAAAVSFPDLGKEGNLASIIFGQPPKVVDSDLIEDQNTSYHLEGFYRFKLTENVSITPGAFVIFNPEHNNDNDTIYVGTIRTTFEF
ncbi:MULTISPECIES: iron uptake porin [Cyanophyceae]|uniref:iron uptake porin n=1 Tax=Cyanophyceae TaxID=3028117 RepID=UPI0002A67448|nr:MULTISPECIES: iron uptake porin [Cyanophyceae]AFZ33453.1 cyanobacterial porin [Gloeocapsa sp. PCC 7428]PPS41964.1 hypothetical protein B1A85_15960 [Chroococcidiopsis sp. TS-821]